MLSVAKPGDRVGRYVIEALLGQGGMGHVYRAYDEVLRRRVALKLLRAVGGAESGGGSAPTVARILREARMAAALDHPNVVAIFDFGEEAGTPYIVMEHVTGQLLRAFVGRADIPVEERVRWLVEIARALAAAHRAGLVHRDVKPENVIVREDGVVKVLDFGIARRAFALPHLVGEAAAASAAGGGEGATLEEGPIVGTPGYMAPEQLRGGAIDARVDQFAWGVVAYEVLTGQLPWLPQTGGQPESLFVQTVSRRAPRLVAADLGITTAVAGAVERALQKAPDERFVSMDQLLVEMGWGELGRRELSGNPASSGDTPEALGSAKTLRASAGQRSPESDSRRTLSDPARPPPGHRVAAGAAVTLAITLGLAALWARARPPTTSNGAQLARSAPPAPFHPRDARRITFDFGCEEYPSFTPDGRVIVFDGASGYDSHLFALDLAAGTRRELTHDPGWQYAATVSPDGHWIAFLESTDARSATFVIPFGEAPSPSPPRLVAAGIVRPSWSPDGSALWAGKSESAQRIDLASGETTRTLAPPAGYEFLALLELEDGRVLARFTDRASDQSKALAIYPKDAEGDAGKGDPRWLVRDALEEVWVRTPDGASLILAYVAADHQIELRQVPLDGAPSTRILETNVSPTKGLAISRAGDRAIWSTCATHAELAALSRGGDGGVSARSLFPAADWEDEAPSGIPGTTKLVVVSDRSGAPRLWVLDRANVAPPRMLPVDFDVTTPAVSPDGRMVAFATPSRGIHVAPLVPAEPGPPRRLTSAASDEAPSFSRDGRLVYFQGKDDGGRPYIAAVGVEGGPPAIVLPPGSSRPFACPTSDVLGFVALDDTSSEGMGRPMILDVRSGRQSPLSSSLTPGFFSSPRFSPDGKRVVLRRGLGEILEVDAATGAILSRFDAGSDQFSGLGYVGGEVVLARRVWLGDLWSASGVF